MKISHIAHNKVVILEGGISKNIWGKFLHNSKVAFFSIIELIFVTTDVNSFFCQIANIITKNLYLVEDLMFKIR